MKVKKQSNIGNQDFKDSYFYRALPDTLFIDQNYVNASDIYHTIFVVREYPLYTNKHGILQELGRMEGVNLKIYINKMNESQVQNILKNSQRKNNMLKQSNDIKEKLEGNSRDSDLQDILKYMRENSQTFVYVTVIIDILEQTLEALKELCDKVIFILNSNDIVFTKLQFRQEDGFISSQYFSQSRFDNDYRRVIPSNSTGNLYPFAYLGKYDTNGFYIGCDEYNGDVIDDLCLIDESKTNSNVLVLGNSGQGKSYLLKLLICNLLESGKKVIVFDPEDEYTHLTNNLDGESISFTQGGLYINPLEFQISQDNSFDYKGHIAFLLNFFSISCSLDSLSISILEPFIHGLYKKNGITEQGLEKDYSFPNLSMLYDYLEETFNSIDDSKKTLYTKNDISKLCVSLYPICKGIYSKYFIGHYFDLNSHLIRYCLKDIFTLKGNVKEGVLYNILNFTENILLNQGNTALIIDELYLFLENKICIESIRSCIKRVRKRDSLIVLATQNISDLLLPNICEYTKPLLAIPQRRFLFSPGNVDKEKYQDLLDISKLEYSHIQNAKRGRCIYKCGNETYILDVHAPDYKAKLF